MCVCVCVCVCVCAVCNGHILEYSLPGKRRQCFSWLKLYAEIRHHSGCAVLGGHPGHPGQYCKSNLKAPCLVPWTFNSITNVTFTQRLLPQAFAATVAICWITRPVTSSTAWLCAVVPVETSSTHWVETHTHTYIYIYARAQRQIKQRNSGLCCVLKSTEKPMWNTHYTTIRLLWTTMITNWKSTYNLKWKFAIVLLSFAHPILEPRKYSGRGLFGVGAVLACQSDLLSWLRRLKLDIKYITLRVTIMLNCVHWCSGVKRDSHVVHPIKIIICNQWNNLWSFK